MKKKILYVEDHKDTANVVKVILGVVGFKVDIALTGKEGLTKLHENKYDLIIFDIMLPDISGLDLFAKAKNSPKNKNSKFLFLSVTHVPEEKRKQLEKEGVLEFIPKPFEKGDLVTRVQKAVEKKSS